MNPKMLLLVGLAAGYVLGARAGREKYDTLKAKANELWENPRVARARRDVEAYARQQAPIIRERAEAAAKAAPGVIADAAKDVASKTSEVARDVATKTSDVAKDVAGKTSEVAKDVAAKTSATAKDVASKTSATAKNVAAKATDVAGDVRDSVVKTSKDLRGMGEDAVDRAVTAAGTARDNALETDEPDDRP
ncbi:protoporphyrinogen oxidase [Glaciihabitans arcticus]|uniref:Protoporphyrinogen oxidase n=1 Tax=Glaciihabitans arcticus TaxID=2668039 RepID=A0A4Q9GW22_9MICO|nr:protoporphyrinogen oxidase [Glaciihabitans arcticus]TBN56400.1 protoporphyrinogen oxidase [Glaciihabitans arcticus]